MAPSTGLVVVLVLQCYLLSAENLDVPKCATNTCTDPYAECFNISSTRCCVCPPGFSGGGAEKCTNERSPERFIRLRGTISIKHFNDTYEYSFPISHETLTIRGPPLGQTAIHDVPSTGTLHNTLSLLTPFFHYINILTSLPTENSRIYNIFSLTGGFSNRLRLQFNSSFEGHGVLLVEALIQQTISDSDYFEGEINVEVKSQSSFRAPEEVFVEKHTSNSAIYYEKIGRGVVRFERQRFEFMPKRRELNKTLHVTILGAGYITVDEAACLLENDSLVQQGKDGFVARLAPKGYCNTACPHSSKLCTIFCLDYPTLESKYSLFTEPEGIRRPRVIEDLDEDAAL
uniref:EGF-like domain-containing protein n=1 Tax=Mesocestoides corti TaxID=53468 RepID=A0A5K3F8T7_MESCO